MDCDDSSNERDCGYDAAGEEDGLEGNGADIRNVAEGSLGGE
jgi:hypothetical protein